MRILFIKLSSIGDIIHTIPALAAASQAFPEAKFSWVAEARSAEILRDHPLLENLIIVDTRSFRGGRGPEQMALSFGKQLRGLRETRFDIAIDFQGLLKSALIGRLARVGTVFGFERRALREPASSFLLNRSVAVTEGINVIRKNLALAAGALGFDAAQFPISFPLATASADAAEAQAIIDRTTAPFAILNPAGGWVTKLWPAEKFGLLADRLWEEFGLRSVIATAPSETELARRALAASQTSTAIHATPSLKGFFELARKASIYVGGDTGPTHLAVAAGAPVVGLFGPTEWWRNGSLNPDDVCVERTDIGCRTDCHRRTCGNWICLDISVETVLDGVRRRLATT